MNQELHANPAERGAVGEAGLIPLLGLGAAEIARMSLVARLTTNMVVITDLERRILWVNEGFTKTTGYTLEEIRGKIPGRVLQCPKTDRAAVARIRKALERREQCRTVLLNVDKFGREYWVDLEIRPVHDESGATTGFISIESDVTAAVTARAEVAASERRQKLFVAGADLGTWDWHVPSGRVEFNARWCHMLGYEPSEIEPHARSRERVAHPDDIAEGQRLLEDHFAGRSDFYRFEHRLRHKDGSTVWVLDAGKVYERDAAGQPVRMAGIHLDITERRQADERFELVVKGSAAGIWDWNVVTGEDYLSPRLKELLGYSDEEIRNTIGNWFELVHSDDRLWVMDAIERHFTAREPYSVEYRMKTKSGEYRWYHAAGQAVWDGDGRPVRMAGSLEDIHARKTVEVARARLAAIVEHSQDAILDLATDGTVVNSNAAARALLGAAAEPGRREAAAVPLEEQPRESMALVGVAAGRVVGLYESLRRSSDGRIVEVAVSASPVRDETGSVVGVSKIVRDISERRERRELEELNALLEQQNRRLADMTDRAHRFVDDVSHEFRTPLTVIKEYSSIIADGLGGPVTEQQAEWLRTIESATVDLNQMVEDFLDSSKLRSGRLRVDRREVPVDAVLARVRRLVGRKAAARGIRVVERIDPSVATIFADEEKLRRVLMNLLANAIKFSPDHADILLGVRALPTGDVEFAVTDRGIGLTEADARRLFERFRQLPNALAPSVKGFGLGLNIARQLVWLNLGGIRVESEYGEGATFAFTVPTNDLRLIVDRFFDRLSEQEEPLGSVALIRIEPIPGAPEGEDLRRLVVAATRPTDIVLPCPRGGFVVFGPTDNAGTWSRRLGDGIEAFGEPEDPRPFIVVEGVWAHPDESDVARASILREILSSTEEAQRCEVGS